MLRTDNRLASGPRALIALSLWILAAAVGGCSPNSGNTDTANAPNSSISRLEPSTKTLVLGAIPQTRSAEATLSLENSGDTPVNILNIIAD